MGRNIACAITGVPITDGDKVRMIILTPNKKDSHKEHSIYLGSALSSQTELYVPAALPIACEYEEDTSTQNVIKDSNVLAIEKAYGLNIERIAGILQENFGIYDSAGLLIHHFAENINLFESYNELEPLLDFGFKEVEGFYTLEGYEQFRFQFSEEGSDLTSYIGDLLISSEYVVNPLTSALELIYRYTGDLLGIKPENRELAIELHNMTAMFIHEEVYQSLADRENKEIREPHFNDSDFVKDYSKLKKDMQSYLKMLEKDDTAERELMSSIGLPYVDRREMFNPFRYIDSSIRIFDKMTLLDRSYKFMLDDESIQKLFIQLYNFTMAMRSANKIFIPSYCGEQFLYSKGLHNLNQLSAKILATKEVIN